MLNTTSPAQGDSGICQAAIEREQQHCIMTATSVKVVVNFGTSVSYFVQASTCTDTIAGTWEGMRSED